MSKVHVGIDTKTGRGKGFAFISYFTTQDAKRAYKYFKGRPLDGRELRVDWDIGVRLKRSGYGMEAEKPGAEEQQMEAPKEGQGCVLSQKPSATSRSSNSSESSRSSSQSSRSDD